MLEKSNIQRIDFAELYVKQKSISSFKPKNATDWDKKAQGLNERIKNSVYLKDFVQKVELGNAKTLLDIGCGTGDLSLALADRLEKVYCLDFSAQMLKCVRQNAKEKGFLHVQTLQKSLYDDWSNVPECDILIASRCLEVKDLKNMLEKLNSKAKKVYISYKVGGSFVDEDILNAIDKTITPKPDFIYLINILYQMNIFPKIDFIRSESSRFDVKNAEEFVEKVRWSLGDLDKKDEENLRKFYEKSYRHKKQKDYIRWAFISYDT